MFRIRNVSYIYALWHMSLVSYVCSVFRCFEGDCVSYCNVSDLPHDVAINDASLTQITAGESLLITCKDEHFHFVMDYSKNETTNEGKNITFKPIHYMI